MYMRSREIYKLVGTHLDRIYRGAISLGKGPSNIALYGTVQFLMDKDGLRCLGVGGGGRINRCKIRRNIFKLS